MISSADRSRQPSGPVRGRCLPSFGYVPNPCPVAARTLQPFRWPNGARTTSSRTGCAKRTSISRLKDAPLRLPHRPPAGDLGRERPVPRHGHYESARFQLARRTGVVGRPPRPPVACERFVEYWVARAVVQHLSRSGLQPLRLSAEHQAGLSCRGHGPCRFQIRCEAARSTRQLDLLYNPTIFNLQGTSFRRGDFKTQSARCQRSRGALPRRHPAGF